MIPLIINKPAILMSSLIIAQIIDVIIIRMLQRIIMNNLSNSPSINPPPFPLFPHQKIFKYILSNNFILDSLNAIKFAFKMSVFWSFIMAVYVTALYLTFPQRYVKYRSIFCCNIKVGLVDHIKSCYWWSYFLNIFP